MKKIFRFIYIFLLLFILVPGCIEKTDYRQDTDTSGNNGPITKTSGSRLDLIEEVYHNMNYDRVIENYAAEISSSASITRFRYYVIFSELDENTTYNLIDKDIRHTVDAMINNYVSAKPDSITPIFLFENMERYKDFSVNFIGIDENDLSTFGFYKISKNIIVIRYVSWKGSTSHEITHSLVQYDFPDMPSWFNEGLAALHEKYIYKDGHLLGDFSWRIVALRRAFRENTYTPLKELMETNDDELYGKRSAFYYAQSRYLLMYIQQNGLLEDYYRLFRDTYDEDKTGITQLEKTTGRPLGKIDDELTEYIKSFKQERW